MTGNATQIVADIRVAQQMDRLVITTRHLKDQRKLLADLRAALPGGSIRLGADGVWLADPAAGALLDVEHIADFRWTGEARRFAENRRQVQLVHAQLRKEVSEILEGGRSVAERYLGDVSDLSVLDDHQIVNVAAMTLEGGYGLCLFDEQGAGKTVSLIYAFDVLVERDVVDFALIIAPKSMVPEWQSDFTRFMGGVYKTRLLTGSHQQKWDVLQGGADVVVTNFETVVSLEDELRGFLSRYNGRCILVVDESFFVKNLEARRTQAIRRLREWCGRAFVLCGTPAPNAPQDLIQQFNIVDFGLTFSGVSVPKQREAALPIVQQAVEARGLFVRHLKADVLRDLPLKQFQRVLLPLAPQQKELYLAALHTLVDDLRSIDDESFLHRIGSFLAQRSSLLQICSNPVSIVQHYNEIPCKLQALDHMLEEMIERQQEKVVLWSFYTTSLNALFNRYDRYNPVRYDGSVTDVAARRDAVRSFQEDDTTMLFVGNPAAAGAGLTLHRARFSIYESMSNQAAHYLQSLDRIHRRGQNRPVEYFILLCEGTIEVTEYESLVRKEEAAQRLLRDSVDTPLTREVMLTEALNTLHSLEDQL